MYQCILFVKHKTAYELRISDGSSDVCSSDLSLFMSDERMKRDVRLLGVTEGGHNWYEYRYIHRPELFQGVMAQELEITNPDAVHEIDGIKYVDYAKVHRSEARRVGDACVSPRRSRRSPYH